MTRRSQVQLFRVRYRKSLNTRAGFPVFVKLDFGLTHRFRGNLSLEPGVLGKDRSRSRHDGPRTRLSKSSRQKPESARMMIDTSGQL